MAVACYGHFTDSTELRMRYRALILRFALLAAVGVSAAAEPSFVMVDAENLGRHWRFEREIVHMEVGKPSERGYGCVAIGFMIDRTGRVGAVRPLRRAFSKDVTPKRARELTMGVTSGSQALGPYTPAPENPNRTEVFTVLAVPVIGRKHAAAMSPAQQQAIAAQLRPSCEIAGLAAWVDSHDMRKEPAIEPAPEIDFSSLAAP